MLTERQGKILNCIVAEYIVSKTPVGSKVLARKYRFGIKPSTMRIEFHRLTELGYLAQPHTSAGRVPTDKGYRFYVDNLQPKSKSRELREIPIAKQSRILDKIGIEKEIDSSFKFFQHLTQRVAELTSSLTLTYFPQEEIVFKEGWDEIFKEPEFSDAGSIAKFLETVQKFESHFDELKTLDELKIFIGRENQLPCAREFTTIVSRIHLPEKKEGIVAILGPKRMAYDKNLGIMSELTKLLEENEY
jgi:transcriptional regulator of heat shock response